MSSSLCPDIQLLDDNQIVSTAAAHLAKFRLLAEHLIKEKDQLWKVVRAFIYVLAGDNIVGLLGSTYNGLFLRFPTFNSTEHAFAVVIVQITQTHLKCYEPPESFGSFCHLAHEFHRPYRGDAPNRFLTFVSRVKKDFQGGFGAKPWYCGTSIVQSSGAGKTRMVYECQKLTPLLYVSFGKMGVERNARDVYPLADQSVRSYFENAHRDHPHKPDLQTDAEKYQHLCDLNRFEPVSRGDDLPEPLDRYPRNNHFKHISELAASQSAAAAATDPNHGYLLQDSFIDILKKPLLDLNEQLTAASRHLRSGQEEAGVPSPPVLVAFDECVEMLAKQLNRDNRQLDCLRRAWSYIRVIEEQYNTLSFWLVLISTSIQAIYVPVYFEISSSSRGMPSAPMPIFVGVGVNLLAEEQFFLRARYGAVLQRHGLALAPVHEGGGLLFDDLKRVMKKSVDEHMRTMSHISKRGTMYVDSPSEPVLAIAASLIMLPTVINTYGSILENFGEDCIGEPAIAPAITGLKGMHGQLASRIALITAWDAAKRKELDALELQEISQYATVLTRAVPLETILAGLADLDEANADQLRQRLERVQQHGSSTRPALQRPPAGTWAASSTIAWTNFTHFDVLPDHITEISPEYLWCCWKRGLGLQMARSQHGIDGILPVFMGSLEEPFVSRTGTQDDVATSIEMHAARYMTYVAWEAKNRDEPQPEAGWGKPDGIRAVFQNLSIRILRRRPYELLNEVPNSIWNDHMQPALPSISAAGVSNPPAAATATARDDNDGAAQCKRQRMDLD
ncbi:uncharacterized protein UHOD_02121 [Ustilago sp. UG-2017b]|nr:uncharacterized protein UHOD_02121 [Ustilago sp. UG-2017b]